MFHDDTQDSARRTQYSLTNLLDRSQWNYERLKSPTRNISLFAAPISDVGPTQGIKASYLESKVAEM